MTTELLVGGRVYASSAPDANAIAITDGIVSWVGDERVGRALHPDARLTDVAGAFIAPAFVDSHVHVTATGLALTGLDLTAAMSLDQCLHLVAQFAASHTNSVIWGCGWDETRWPEGRAPSTAELDAAVPGRAVYLARVDEHSAIASSALRALTPELDRAAGFAPHGPLTSAAHHQVRLAARDSQSAAERAEARRVALDTAAAYGIVAVHECGGHEIAGLDDFTELLATEHGVGVVGYWGEAARDEDHARDLINTTGALGLGGDLFVDGAIGSHTAWLRDPYCDHTSTGNAYLSADQIHAHLRACTLAKVPAGFHVIGDAAMDAVTGALTRLIDELGAPAVATRGHRVEHAEMIGPEQATVLANAGVIASMQPVFDELWGGPGNLYEQRLGPRAAQMNNFAALAATGITLAFGSDTPVTTMNPWAAVRAAITHSQPGSSISPRAAFGAATRGGWRASGVRDPLAGTLNPGAPASFAIWEAGELTVTAPRDAVQRWSTDPRAGIPPLPVLEPGSPLPVCLRTVRDGVTIYAR